MADEENITAKGDPRKPNGVAGAAMLERMNAEHFALTGWGLDYLELSDGDHVLDVGCGGGATLRRIEPRVPNGHLTGLDYSPVSVAKSRDENRDAIAAGRMDVIEGSVSEMPFADRSFDKIVTVETFYFWPDPQKDLMEVRRVLKPGGLFLLISEIYDNAALTEHQRENVARYGMFNPSVEEFRGLFLAAGFSRTDIHVNAETNWLCVTARK